MKLLRRMFSMVIGRRPPQMQVGALCVHPDTSNVLLITSRGTGRWVIPKGWPMEGRSLSGAAAQEAWEEAGVRGDISEQELGRYDYDKDQDEGFAIPVQVRVFRLKVLQMQDRFPEHDQRQREWFSPTDAAGLVSEPGLKRLLRTLPAA